jgi:ring-1,2-phenylacetyl-CoA epoxidase subunit PaaD
MVRSKLDEAGYHDVTVTMMISPPWSTDWISEEGKEKLLSFGISPPGGRASLVEDDGKPKNCPQCGSTHAILISRFGSTPCKASYKCADCMEPFEYFKCF